MNETEILIRGIVAGVILMLPLVCLSIIKWVRWKGWSQFWKMMHSDLEKQNETLFTRIKLLEADKELRSRHD